MWIVINATNRCNLNCKTCLRSSHTSEDIDINLIKSFVPKLKKNKVFGVSITGGEPVLHPKFKEIVEEIVSHGFHLGIVSNGQLYDRYIEILEPYKKMIYFISISLDSHNKKINDYIRGEGSYEKAIKAIREFKRLGYFVKVTHTVNKKNLDDLEHFVDFAFRLGSDSVLILKMINTPSNRELILDNNEKKIFHEKLKFLRTNYMNKVQFGFSTGYYKSLTLCRNINGLNEITIDFKGNVIFCCDTILGCAVIGNLNKEPLEILLNRLIETQNTVKNAIIKSMDEEHDEPNDCNFCSKFLSKLIQY